MLRGRWVKLSQSGCDDGFKAGNLRQDNAETNNRAGGVAPVARDKQRENNIFAAQAERATWELFKFLPWNSYRLTNFEGTADIGDFIDAKATAYEIDKIAMIVKRDKEEGDGLNFHPEWAYVLAAGILNPWWYIAGWMWGHEILKRYKAKKWTSWAYLVPEKDLHPIMSLVEIARVRALKNGA